MGVCKDRAEHNDGTGDGASLEGKAKQKALDEKDGNKTEY